MDWHLLEISIVTILAIWVYLFSPNPLSRGVAVVMLAINIFWVLIERDRRDSERRRRLKAQAEAPTQQLAASDSESAAPLPKRVI